jgi:hypothetical protein
MGPNGIGDWSQSYATPSIPTAPGIQPGKGSYVTIWNNPAPGNAGHVWIEVLGRYFESSGSGGVHQTDQSEVNPYLNSRRVPTVPPDGHVKQAARRPSVTRTPCELCERQGSLMRRTSGDRGACGISAGAKVAR